MPTTKIASPVCLCDITRLLVTTLLYCYSSFNTLACGNASPLSQTYKYREELRQWVISV
jgi:hypothetical protein